MPRRRRPDPCVRRARPPSSCRRSAITRVLALLVAVSAAVGAPSAASARIPLSSRADISAERAVQAARSGLTASGITTATPANTPELAEKVVGNRSRPGTSRSVVSRRVSFAIPHSTQNALPNRLISMRKTSGSSPIGRQIDARTSSAIGSPIRGRIDTRATTSGRSLYVRSRLATSPGRADVPAQQRESLDDRRLMLQIGGALAAGGAAAGRRGGGWGGGGRRPPPRRPAPHDRARA